MARTALVLQPLNALLTDSHGKSPIQSVRFGPSHHGEAELDRLSQLPDDTPSVLCTTPEWFVHHAEAFGRYHQRRRIVVGVLGQCDACSPRSLTARLVIF